MKRPTLILLHVTCVLNRADDALVSTVAAPGTLDHRHIRPAQPERIPPVEARCAWQFRYASAAERDEAHDRMRGLFWSMTEDRPVRG